MGEILSELFCWTVGSRNPGVGQILLELLYKLVGLYALGTGLGVLRRERGAAGLGTALFWSLFGLVMLLGPLLAGGEEGEGVPQVVGGGLVVMALLTLCRLVRPFVPADPSRERREREAARLGWRIFLPALAIGLLAFAIAQFGPRLAGLDKKSAGLLGLGGGAVLAGLLALAVTGSSPGRMAGAGAGLLRQVGPAGLLPLVLAALGKVFAEAKVGELIQAGIAEVVPLGHPFLGVTAYCLGMALFTMVMGNAFAAFLVITGGVGLPFVIAQGGDPALTAALGMTAGYCGTLLTPMAANFNIVPVALLETRSKYRVIRSQAPLALIMLFIHILLMYTLAF